MKDLLENEAGLRRIFSCTVEYVVDLMFQSGDWSTISIAPSITSFADVSVDMYKIRFSKSRDPRCYGAQSEV